MRIVFCIIGILLLAACTANVAEVKEASPFPSPPEMEPPMYGPTEDAPYDARVFVVELTKSGFSPDTITINSGDDVKLLVTALDDDHDFRMADFGILEPLPKMQEAVITLKPAAGTYEFSCVDCKNVVGKLIVR